MRRRGLLGLSLPLGAAGCLAGHAAGYAIVGTSAQDARIHGYLAFAPLVLAVCVALVVLALALRLAGRLEGTVAAWPFAVLPPIAFLAQELAERLLAGLPAHAIAEPAVFAGLAAQAPVALAAFLLARLLVRVTDSAAEALARPSRLALPALSLPLLRPVAAPGRAPLAFDRLGRAPPLR